MSRHTPGALAEAKLGYLFLLVHDFDQMVRFYRDTLGLSVAYYTAGENAFFHTGDGGPLIALYPGREDKSLGASHWFLAFDVNDLESAVASLRSLGVAVGDIEDVPFGRAAELLDPEGNRIELHEPAPGA